LSEVVEQAQGAAVQGLAVSATSGTFVLVNDRGQPLTPGIMYDDRRLADETLVPEVLETGAALWSRLALRPQGTWPLVKLLALHRAGDWPAGAVVEHQGDFVLHRLAGARLATDSAQALKSGADIQALTWPTGVFEELGLPVQAFPEIVLPGSPIGHVGKAAAKATGLATGTALFAGATDGCCAQFGAGAVSPGDWNSVLGTTLVVKGVSRQLLRDPAGAVYSHRAPHADCWLPGGASSTGARIIARYFGGADIAALPSDKASAAPVCFPLLDRGERFPFCAPEATGFLVHDGGRLSLDAAAATLERSRFFDAIALGLALVERLCYDALQLAGAQPPGSVRFTGGGSSNALWNQLRCDVLGTEVLVPASEGSVTGAAMLAAAELGDLAKVSSLFTGPVTVLQPDHGRLSLLMSTYRSFVEALNGSGWVGDDLAALAVQRSCS
jgi:sugar (pentulose or hexulose) kinase